MHQLGDDADTASLPEVEKRPYLSSSTNTTPILVAQDPFLPETHDPLSYIDVFVDDSVGLAQITLTERRVRKFLVHAIDDTFSPLNPNDGPFRREHVFIKKLRQDNCSWSTTNLVLCWIIDTTTMTIHPPHIESSSCSTFLIAS